MSYNITGTTITLTRGDTFEALVSATKRDGTQYIPVAGDTIRFAMKENYDDPRPLLVKDIPIDTMMLTLEPSKSYVDGKVGSASDIQSGDTVKTFSKDYKTVTTVYANGNQLVKTFSDDMKTITSVLTDSEGTVIATETKTLSDDGLTISTDVVYG